MYIIMVSVKPHSAVPYTGHTALPGKGLSQDHYFPGPVLPIFPQRATGLLDPFIAGAVVGEGSTSTPPGTEAR